MKRRGKIIATISTLCLALVMLTASVLAATSVSFNIGGSVSYIIEDVYVEFEARVYSSSKHFASDEELATASETLASSNFTALNAKTKLNDSEDYTFNKEQIKNTSNPSVWSESNEDYFDFYSSVTGGEHTSLDIDLAYSTTTQKLTYFVVIEVTNLSSETVYAYVNTEGENALAFPENSWTYSLGDYQTLTSSDNTKYFVFAFGLKDMTLGIESSDFNFPIVVSLEEPEIAYPAIAVENKGGSVDEQTTVSTSLDNATNHKLAVQTVDSTQLVGMDFSLNQAQASRIQTYSSEDNITLSFELWFKDVLPEYVEMGIPENITPYQFMLIDSGGELLFAEYLNYLSGILFVYSDSIENYTTTSTPLTNEDNGLVISAVLDEITNVETYTVTIPKTEVASGIFSIVLNPEMMVTMETVGVNMNFEKLWSSTENLQTSWKGLLEPGIEKHQIGGNSFVYSGTKRYSSSFSASYIAIPFEVLNIPEDKGKLEIYVNYVNESSDIVIHQLVKGKQTTIDGLDESLIIDNGLITGSEFGYALDLPLETNELTIFMVFGTESSISNSVTITSNFGTIEYFTFEEPNSFEKTITGLTEAGMELEDLVIPETHLGTPISKIGENAFKGNTKLKNVTIAKNVDYIEDYAFSGCNGLESLTILSPDFYVRTYAFEGCINLANISYNATYTSYRESPFKNILNYCNSDNINLVLGNDESEVDISIPSSFFSYCSNIKSIDIKSNVTSIGDRAFAGCGGLESIKVEEGNSKYISKINGEETNCIIERGNDGANTTYTIMRGCKNSTLSNVITSIGEDAFSSCMGLTTIEIPSSVLDIGNYAFSGCSGLSSLTIPSSITSIGSYAFSRCTGLTGELKIPDTVKSIGNNAFQKCSGLSSFNFPSSIPTISSYLFESCTGLTGELKLPNSVTNIDSYAFKGCTGLTSIEIPDGVTNIGASAFEGCTGLKGELVIPDSVTDIGGGAFKSCAGLTGELKIPDNVKSIGSAAFSGCSGLTGEINTILEKTTGIGLYAFYNCSGLTGAVNIPKGITSIGSNAFRGCSGLTGELIIPDSVTTIESSAFGECSGLNGELIIPYGVTTIGYAAFDECTGLSGKLVIPNSVTSIEAQAFSRCSGLTGVVIPDSIISIGQSAFYGWTASQIIYMEGTPTTLGDNWNGDATVYYYSETQQAGYWYYDENGNPAIWE